MEEPVKEQQPLSAGNSARPKLQRYALRSSSKSKENKPDAPDRSISSESKRGLSTPRLSRSVCGLDFSGNKDKSTSAKPPRRLSNPVKASPTPNLKLVGNITPISESRTMRSGNVQGSQSRSQTPASEISRTSSRMKFNLLSSSSYWLNQIKLSESADKHSVSLGFFKLASEARCEPFQKMKDELKSYVQRHQLAELGEVKELLQSYDIAENIEQPQVSESITQVPEEGTGSSDDEEVHCSSSSTMDTAKLKPEPLDTESTEPAPVKIESTKKETSQKNNHPGSRLRENLKNSANSRPASDSGSSRLVKKSEKPTTQQTNKEKSEVKKQGKKSDVIKAPISPTHAEDNAQGNKENMDVQTPDEMILTEVA
ncbi:hypothetical protein AAZX31_05G027700 [Glycine max]|uniref:Uncharacterized protein n=2 Tax=Glycine subgen. Soja TaxID=1462606 RepID=I1JZR2_SOYBN|nr:uncharacterized protein LOC100793420 [Glycine max]XP_028231403.1 uncharacterized protein LOC114411875 [Glycine soja]KAG5028006.1 hypothetical protein JHK87_011520 [Glycine soja]KAG5056625.1 hypothetical protein JHK86_011621 [Glycine max]KAG5153663.1 hypothetical protein JHK82_011632 [Glycine max]KAH1132527.1 hypothetical protein GYH30_011398 [Glycine max]KHN48672.1 hypothetical protein glysoja_015820 [Glycine soja]|eukprot:XP_006579539.1 uncharacterized protein LOC100793420 [Glycine max]